MKTKITLVTVILLLVTSFGYAQKKIDPPKSIIATKVAIKKYYNIEELQRLQKGELLVLYMERIETLIKTLPYIAFATKPGVTMTDIGIPNDKDNSKLLDNQLLATDEFLKANSLFESKILPYSDTSKLISAILFYEEIMKSLHEYSTYH